MSEPDRDEKGIFLAALDKATPEERAAFLEGACGADREMLSRVRELLSAHEGSLGPLDSPPPGVGIAPTLDQPITEKPGTQIGPYKLLQQLGEGGMGVVYMAEQKEPVKRRVALKIIKPGMDTRQVIARFEAERQALAMMDHPNIAKVLDAGATETGRPYFVMELVNGLPVTKYCDEQHLTPKERLELFVPICQAVQHAHQKGIIHRDLKPSNILVAEYDHRAVPKIIDFGVAKATSQTLTEKTMFTQIGQIVGTLEYMSPEQAKRNQLDVDTRSDIYSLGVVLYELLTGETPFNRERLRSAAFDEMLRIIREEEPSKPSTKVSSSQSLPSIAANRRIEPAKLGSMIRGELDWIVLKAMEKDRARRYETASKFAEDVQHYLNDEAVTACPPSRAYRFRKFARRNKAALLSTALLATALLVAVAGITGGVGWVVRDRAAQLALAERERTERQDRITTQVELLLSDVDRLAQEQRWVDALAAAKRAEATLAGGEAEAAVNDKVRTALRELEFVARLNEIRNGMAVWKENNFDYAGALQSYRQVFREFGVDLVSLNAAAAVARLKETPRIILPVVAALDDVVFAQRHAKRSDDSDFGWKSLVEVARGLDPDPLRNELRAMWGRDVIPEAQAELRKVVESFDVGAQGPPAIVCVANTLHRAGIHDLEVQLLRRGHQRFPGDYWLNLDMGNALCEQDQYAEAVRFFSMAWAIWPDSTAALNNLGIALVRQGRRDEAIACYRRAIVLDPEFARAYANLGDALCAQGLLSEAIAYCRKAIALAPRDPLAHLGLGAAMFNMGQLDEAIGSFRKAIELDPKLAAAHVYLGLALQKLEKLNEAIACFETAIALDPTEPKAHYNFGNALRHQGQLDRAIACFRKAIELNPKYTWAHVNLGIALEKQGKPDEAVTCYRNAIALDPRHFEANYNLGNTLLDQGQLEAAIACFRKIVEIAPEDSRARYLLGIALQKQGNLGEAIDCFQKAIKLDPKNVDANNNLGLALGAQGRFDEAIACLRKAIEFAPEDSRAQNNLGAILIKQEKLDEAIGCFRKAIELEPDYSLAWSNLGSALARTGDLDEALKCFRKVHEQQGPAENGDSTGGADARKKLIKVLLTSATDLLQRGRTAEAISVLSKVTELGETSNRPWIDLAKRYLATGEREKYDAICRSLEERFPPPEARSVADWGYLGQLLYAVGQYHEARNCLEKVIELRGETRPSMQAGPRWWYYTLTLGRLGETERAREYYHQLEILLQQAAPADKARYDDLREEAASVLGIPGQAVRSEIKQQ